MAMAELAQTAQGAPIIFYDGECGLCNKSIQFVMRHDRDQVFYYAPLQGDTAERAQLKPEGDPEAWSVVLVDEKGVHRRSTAALRIASKLGGFWSLLALFLIVPRFIRDAVYGWVARNRYRVWGKLEACPLPPPEARARFLP